MFMCCALSKTDLALFSTGSTQEDLSRHNSKIVGWNVKNQINFFYIFVILFFAMHIG